MAEEQLRDVIEGIRARLQAELEAQLGTLASSHDQALTAARRSADQEAERRWAARLDAARAEWEERLASEVAAVRAEVERSRVADTMKLRVEAEQAAAEAAEATRRALEEALAAERTQARADLERTQIDLGRAQADREHAQAELERERTEAQQAHADRERAHAELERVQAELKRVRAHAEEIRERSARELEHARQAERSAVTHALAPPPAAGAPSFEDRSRLLEALRAIDESASQTAAHAATVRAAAGEAPRAAGREAGFLAEVLRAGETHSTDGTNGSAAPAFAGLAPGRRALAVPLVLDGRPVAVLYADEAVGGQPSSSWLETVQIVGRHAASVVAALTAVRTAQALGLVSGGTAGAGAAAMSGEIGNDDEAQGARRYAKLLVSEIKLYNENMVRIGREQRDLLARLKPEIERARHLYDERIAATVRGRDLYFQQELVQTLADGDQSLLG